MELPMIRDVCYTKGWYGLALFSDMHIGATDIDEKRLRDDLKTACDEGRRILINGDLTESIFPSDRKRYTPSRAMSSRDDVINEIMYDTVELLTPYVDYIDLIGTGNHDDAPIKYSGFDIVGAVCTHSPQVTRMRYQSRGRMVDIIIATQTISTTCRDADMRLSTCIRTDRAKC